MTQVIEGERRNATTARSYIRGELPEADVRCGGFGFVAETARRGSLRFWMIGSGGTSPWRDFNADIGTGGAGILTYYLWGQNWPSAGEIPLDTPAEKLAFIRSALALNVSQLSSVLGVERPTVYAWMGDRAQPHTVNLVRIETICEIASRWARLSNMPLTSTLLRRGESADAILNLLEKSPVDDRALMVKLEELAGAPRARRLGVRAAALKRGMNLETVNQRDDEFEALTGRRGSNE